VNTVMKWVYINHVRSLGYFETFLAPFCMRRWWIWGSNWWWKGNECAILFKVCECESMF